MVMGILSICLILILAGILIFFIYRNANKFLDISHVHIMVMSLSTVISLTMGVTLAFLIHYHFFVALLFGLVLGYIIGRPINLFAIVDGMSSGLMGGMMGVMAPMMTHVNPILLVIFMDLIYIILMAIILKLIFLTRGREEDKRELQMTTRKT
ncbi:hypothetical protein EV207_1646 [Scopulibacillus darangshiensis]|uniref:Uncharacterized protein n=1 Tax=Scopulibacillus darangshiensis TaxID=442528 RepID=A0A4R2NDY0_9BACL|nr:hypothetical protein [Scopulibacillus darangshiensis]TCP19308.1 hypothetical protein EV207_1646 [Scopulibacillus darangshiensis]